MLALLASGLVVLFFYIFDRNFMSPLAISILWIVLPILLVILSITVNIINQSIQCDGKTDLLAHMKISWVTLLIVYGVLLITSVSYVRAPVTSLFAGFFPQNIASSVIGLEARLPVIRGIAIGYYMLFGVLLSQIITSGYGTLCN
jgi:hypothetical protein